jgi:uncharacterized protein (TIGR02246 family)
MRSQRISPVLAAFGTLLLFACNQAPPTVPNTRAADVKAIRELEAQFLVNYHAKDADKLVSSYYADEASNLLPGMPIITGKAAILKSYREELADPTANGESSISKIEVSRSGDLAYIEAASVETHIDPKTKEVMIEKGKYVVVFKKQPDGAWRAIEDIYNPDAPPSPAKK